MDGGYPRAASGLQRFLVVTNSQAKKKMKMKVLLLADR